MIWQLCHTFDIHVTMSYMSLCHMHRKYVIRITTTWIPNETTWFFSKNFQLNAICKWQLCLNNMMIILWTKISNTCINFQLYSCLQTWMFLVCLSIIITIQNYDMQHIHLKDLLQIFLRLFVFLKNEYHSVHLVQYIIFHEKDDYLKIM